MWRFTDSHQRTTSLQPGDVAVFYLKDGLISFFRSTEKPGMTQLYIGRDDKFIIDCIEGNARACEDIADIIATTHGFEAIKRDYHHEDLVHFEFRQIPDRL